MLLKLLLLLLLKHTVSAGELQPSMRNWTRFERQTRWSSSAEKRRRAGAFIQITSRRARARHPFSRQPALEAARRPVQSWPLAGDTPNKPSETHKVAALCPARAGINGLSCENNEAPFFLSFPSFWALLSLASEFKFVIFSLFLSLALICSTRARARLKRVSKELQLARLANRIRDPP